MFENLSMYMYWNGLSSIAPRVFIVYIDFDSWRPVTRSERRRLKPDDGEWDFTETSQQQHDPLSIL